MGFLKWKSRLAMLAKNKQCWTDISDIFSWKIFSALDTCQTVRRSKKIPGHLEVSNRRGEGKRTWNISCCSEVEYGQQGKREASCCSIVV